MANGRLLDYLKRERDNLELDDDCKIDQVWYICVVRATNSQIIYLVIQAALTIEQ